MSIKLSNPYLKNSEYNCFGCSPKHPFGLKLNFQEDGDYITCTWLPSELYQGWNSILHGGIQASLLDEIASWVVSVKLLRAAVTAEMIIRLKKEVKIDNKPIFIRAKLKECNKNIAIIEAEIFDAMNNLCVISEFKYFVFSEKISEEKFNFPNKDSFYE